MKGWIKLNRKIQEHWIWEDEKYLKWWLTILLNVNHKQKDFLLNGEIYKCLAGESYRTLEGWCSMFGCVKSTASRFFIMLEKNNLIKRKLIGTGMNKRYIITVIDWDNEEIEEL